MTRRTCISLAALSLATRSLRAAATPFTLAPLPYAVDALEPFIDAQTMQLHHDKHHQAYVDNLNKALAAEPSFAWPASTDQGLAELLSNLDPGPKPRRRSFQPHPVLEFSDAGSKTKSPLRQAGHRHQCNVW